jgi:hypothetical protein
MFKTVTSCKLKVESSVARAGRSEPATCNFQPATAGNQARSLGETRMATRVGSFANRDKSAKWFSLNAAAWRTL